MGADFFDSLVTHDAPTAARDTATTLLALGSYGDTDSLSTWWWTDPLDDADEPTLTKAGSADVASPSFVCWHPTLPLLYAVSETPFGHVLAFDVGPDGALTERESLASGGGEPCWVICDPIGSALLVANYDLTRRASSMAVIQLADDGSFTGDATVLRHGGFGPVADRQEASHMHQVVPTAYGTVLATDLGSDRLVEYMVDRAAVTAVGRIELPPGTGPRHVVVSSDSTTGFVTGELDGTVTVIRRSDGHWAAAEQVRCSGAAAAGRDVPWDRIYPSHLALVDLDRYLLVANRGVNTLAVLDVSDGLAVVSESPVAAWPRHFASVDDAILVASQRGDVVEAHRFDPQSATLTPLGVLADVATASCVAPSPLR